RMFSQMADVTQAAGPVLFVVAAGNDSGEVGDRYCTTTPRPSAGLGSFPAELASPLAAAGLQAGNPPALGVHAGPGHAGHGGDVMRADYSTPGGHILAPGDDIEGLVGDFPRSAVGKFTGTSSATAHVSGAAAWLLSLDPNLTNKSLRELLLSQGGADVEGTP